MPNEADFIDKLEVAMAKWTQGNYFVPQFIIKERKKRRQRRARKTIH